MKRGLAKLSKKLLIVGFFSFSFSQVATAVLFEPGVGVGTEFTDNAKLAKTDKVGDLIAVGYVGGRLSENAGALTYNALATSNTTVYTQRTLSDKQYYGLSAGADWVMIKDRFNWFLKDTFGQRTINAFDSNTPDNLQNTNVFTFGADIRLIASGRQNLSLTPMFNMFYFDSLLTDNKQYSLTANWNYKMFRLTSIGFNLSVRSIDYTEKNQQGKSIDDTTFTNMAVVLNGQRPRSVFAANLGATNVKRESGQEITGFAGYLNWVLDLSPRSKFETRVSTDFTDTGRVGVALPGNPDIGNEGVQITTDVVRNSFLYMGYIRDGSTFRTSLLARYREVKYSDSPLDRVIRWGSFRVAYPVTPLLSSGAYMIYNRTEELDTNRLDTRFIVGGDLNYKFSRKIRGRLNVKYRQKNSTLATENYDEYTVFVSLVYGFGGVNRPTRAGEL